LINVIIRLVGFALSGPFANAKGLWTGGPQLWEERRAHLRWGLWQNPKEKGGWDCFFYEWSEFVRAGGLAAYSTDRVEMYRQMGIYVSRILNGAKPADLPIMQPTKFELVINVKTAGALGLKLTEGLQQLADEVIE
jgi:hypothetical protein